MVVRNASGGWTEQDCVEPSRLQLPSFFDYSVVGLQWDNTLRMLPYCFKELKKLHCP